MDIRKESNFINYNRETLPPAQLFIGKEAQTINAVEIVLKSVLCKNSGCNTCSDCIKIRERQHHNIQWLHPERNYTLDQFTDLFTTLSFQRDLNESFFFIIQKADFLGTLCANKLLKPMEEPPHGYHFILLAEHTDTVLETIRSRCIIHSLQSQEKSDENHPLYEIFTHKVNAILEFSKLLESITINERESIELLDKIISYWFYEFQKTENNFIKDKIAVRIEYLQKAKLMPPMPASTISFWRTLYLQQSQHIQNQRFE